MSNRYAVCKHISKSKPDIKIDEEVTKAIGENYRTLPMFEKGLHEFTYKKFYSLENNELLNCRWNEYKRTFEDRVFAPFQFVDIRDYHFYNYHNRFMPSQSVYKRGEHRMTLKPGPGVDSRGEMPIPEELLMKRPYPKAKKQRKPSTSVSHKENNINTLNSHLA